MGVKGDPKWLKKNLDLNYIVAEVRETSRKPDEVISLLQSDFSKDSDIFSFVDL